MKKILQRTFGCIGILIVVAVAAVVAMTSQKDKPSEFYVVTDAAGTTYYVYEDDSKDTTYAVVTDAEGNRYAAEFDGNTVGNTVENINDKIELTEIPTNFTGEHTEISVNASDYIGEVVTQQQAPTQQGNNQTPSAPAQTPDSGKQPLTAYRINKYQQVLAGGTYLMEFTDPELSDLPVTMAIKNGNMFIDTTMEIDPETPEMNVKMIYKNADGGTMYLIIDSIKKYFKLPEDIMGEDMDMAAMMEEMEISEINDVSVSEVDINGQKLILESYKDDDGTQFNYFFSGDSLVRRDTINADGTTDSMYISKFTTSVPDSTFEVPSDYGYFNMSWMGALL